MENQISVLIVDDSITVRTALRHTLEKAGYLVVAEAETGKAGVENYIKFQPDITILDMVMPDTAKLEPLDRIIASNRSAKVIMLSAFATPEKVKSAILKGASYFLIKPCEEGELLEVIRKVAEKDS